MEQFKLRSIDELDVDFVNMLNEQTKANVNKNDTFDSLIPEISKEESVQEEVFTESYFKNAPQNENIEPIFTPQPADDAPKAPRPLVPIGQGNATYSPTGEEKILSEDDFDDYDDKSKNIKGGKGALTGKIISIVLLAATIVTFVLGCFVTVFLDNNGSDLGGICFNTMSTDVIDSSGQTIVSKGDLIISKKVEPSEYAISDMIAVPSAIEQERCDIHIINSIPSSSFSSPEYIELMTTDITSSTSYSASVNSSNAFGIVTSYIPVLGGLLHFAMDNAVLVCILFVLLSALWCLILVLIENKKPKANNK